MEKESESLPAIEYKLQGNQLFKENKYSEAIEQYTKAIVKFIFCLKYPYFQQLDATQSVFFANRANCYAKLKQFAESCKDSTTAIELDDTNIKAHLICGKSLAELGKKDANVDRIMQSISKMTKALTLCAGQSQKAFEKELKYYILRAKKLLWYKKNEMEKQNLKESLNYIQVSCKNFLSLDNTLSNQEKKDQLDLIKDTLGNPDTEEKYQIPEYFTCPLSKVVSKLSQLLIKKLFDDPITVSSGYTYEKKLIEKHIKSSGYLDPQTKFRAAIISNQFYSNVNLKQGIEQFLEDNPWAFEFDGQKENYLLIEF